jgi:uncharacterized protein YacL
MVQSGIFHLSGWIIGVLILIVTLYYEETINFIVFTAGTIILYVILGVYGMWFINKRYNEFLTFVDSLLINVEKGEALPSIMELKKKVRPKK